MLEQMAGSPLTVFTARVVENVPKPALLEPSSYWAKNISVDELLFELQKDRAFYDSSGGGVTLSGGEPTLQVDFAQALLRGLKAEGISTALDTCGLCSSDTLDRLLPFTDLVLFDLKLYDTDLHRQFTGSSNRQIFDNLLHLIDIQRKQSLPLSPLDPYPSHSWSNRHHRKPDCPWPLPQ